LRQLVNKGTKTRPDIVHRHSNIPRKLKKKQRIPITLIIECCDALDTAFWDKVEGERLAAKTSSKSILIPEETIKLQKLVTWILTEGHIPVSHPSIEINQKTSSSQPLEELAKNIEEVFDADNLVNFSSTEAWSGETGERIIVSSAAVRQFFVLKYRIPLGKKSRNINWSLEINSENYRELLKSFIQTEGCISNDKGRPRFEFKIQDKAIRDACSTSLNKIGCRPRNSKTGTYNTGIYSAEDFLKFHLFLEEELQNSKQLEESRKLIGKPDILYIIKKKKWCKYIKKARKELSESRPNQAFTEKHNETFPELPEINHARVSNWALKKVPAPLSAALLSSKILSIDPKKIFDQHVQSYISSTSLDEYDRAKL